MSRCAITSDDVLMARRALEADNLFYKGHGFVKEAVWRLKVGVHDQVKQVVDEFAADLALAIRIGPMLRRASSVLEQSAREEANVRKSD